MAARYAVTTGNWTGAIWAATSGGAAGSAAVPTAADGATIDKNVVVTIDDATAVCLSLTLSVGTTGADVGGKIQPSQAANSKITIQNQITSSGASGGSGAYSSTFAFDMSAVPSYTAEIVLNNANAAASTTTGANLAGNVTLVGAVKKRHTVIVGAMSAGATSCTVADATGWAVGDKLVFATTSAYNATPRTDEITIGTVNTGTGAITWTGGTTYAHADNCPVGNFTSNLIIRPGTAGGSAFVLVTTPTANASADIYVTDVEFRSQNAGTAQGSNPFGVNAANSRIKSISNNAFYDFRAGALYIRSMATVVPRSNNIFYTTSASIIPCTTGQDVSGTATIGPDEDYAIFRCVLGLNAIFPEQHQTGHKISGITQSSSPAVGAIMVTKPGIQIENCSIWSSNSGISNTGTVIADTCTFGSDVFAGCDNTVSMQTGAGSIELTDCVFPASVGITGMSSTLPGSQVIVVNRDADPAVQEIYGSHSNTLPIISRVTSGYPAIGAIGPRSTSALQFESNAATAINYEIDIPAKASTAIKILVCVAKNAAYNNAAYTLPSATLSGLGITPVSASGTDVDDTWELLTLDLASGSAPTTDGVLTLTLSSASATAGAKAWFAGVTANPFVSRVRHYGYIFDETSPTRTVDLLTSASFATADAYTGMSITWGASSSVALTGSTTFQKLYDYHQAKATQNVGSALALTGAGTAGSPALFAQGDVTTTGYTLNGGGSLAMGSSTLTASLPWAYTYTGGTFSQATTVPSFSGGTLNIGAAGTYTFTQAASMTVSATPTSASNYVLSSGSFTGTLNFRNTTAYNITVEIPAGVTANSTGSPGAGTVTFVSPQIYQSVTITNLVAGSRVQIYDTTSSTELFNDVVAGTSKTWTDAVAASASRAIRIRVAHVSGTTAYDFLEANIGTCGTTSSDAAVSYLANQTLDTTYNSNAVDGSAVTGITIVEGATDRVQISIAGGSVSWASIYAYQCYWLFDATGITDDGAFIEAPDTANYILTGFKIKNTHASIPLLITGGYGVDSTGSVSALYDTTGTSIFPAPAHVVPYATGSGVTPSDVTDIAAASATASAAAIVAAAVDGTTTLAESLRLSNAVLGGKVSGASTTAETFRNLDDTKDRMVFTVDSSGNRTAVTRDLT